MPFWHWHSPSACTAWAFSLHLWGGSCPGSIWLWSYFGRGDLGLQGLVRWDRQRVSAVDVYLRVMLGWVFPLQIRMAKQKNKTKNSNQKPLYGMIVKLRCDVCVLSVKNTMLILHGPWTFNLVWGSWRGKTIQGKCLMKELHHKRKEISFI